MKLVMPLLTMTLLTFCFPTAATGDSSDIERWCRLTPHPEACAFYLTHPRPPAPPKDRSDFFKMSLQAALDRTIGAQSQLPAVRHRCRKQPEQHAWGDCVELFKNTVLQLNRTLHPPDRYTYHDAQTWLSAALTDLQMCRESFMVVGAPPMLLSPLEKYNASDLISNSLAINWPAAAAVSPGGTFKAGFPGWTTPGERKLLQASTGSVKADLVVAKDGSGGFRTINDAITAVSKMNRRGRLVIYVKTGVYNENVQIGSSMTDITLVGDGKGKTIISGSNSVSSGFSLITSATLSVFGDRFILRDMTVRNTFGPGSQALALLLASDQSVVYRCSIEGYQDTLCPFSQRQFYRDCDVYGTIDFIFGNAAAVLQNCNIYLRRPRLGESNVVTAQGRSDPNQNTGTVIQSSNINASAEFWPVHRSVRSYLGRPWMQYSRTLYLENYIDSSIDPAGWLPWNGNFALSTLYYAEFKNTGPGSRLSGRVKWPGYHIIVKPSMVRQFTVANFIAGGMWLPSTGLPFLSGL